MNDKNVFSASTPAVPASAHNSPPEMQILLPLTPPPTDERPSTSNPPSPVSAVLGLIIRRQCQALAGQSQQLKLQQPEYWDLLTRLKEHPELNGFVNDKLRWEYNPLRELFCIRMPTSIQESFSEQVSQETKIQLARIASRDDEAGKFAARISSVRSGSIQLREFDSDDDIEIAGQSYIECQPDEQFQHEEAEYPGVVYEIAYSQDGRDLDRAAWTYIPYSNGNIRAVVGFELGYGRSKEARLSLWQPRYLKQGEEPLEILDVETVIDHDPFRSSDGSAINTTKTLHLPLNCFATSEVATFHTEGLPGITISYAKLAQFLNKAEQLQRKRQPAPGEESTGKKSTQKTKKRKRPPTPVGEPSSDREQEFRDAESKVKERTVVEDEYFSDQASASMYIPERQKSQRMR